MPEDGNRAASPAISQADSLYRGFPDFSAWGELSLASAWGELSPADAHLWDRFAASLEERRRTATPEALGAAVEVAIRAAALDTGAIEGLYTVDRGFTMTVALQSMAWEQAIEERGAGVRELFEAQLEAYELVLDAVTRKLPITEAYIRALHEKLCAPQKTYRVLTDVGWQEQELPKGQYKTQPNHVRLTDGSFHAYAPVDLVPSEMHRLLEQIRTPEFEATHPVLQASYVHYAFVMIHPFADGNGRVARALASTYFYRAQSIPLVIFANQRPAYLDALAAADRGDFRPVISLFRDRGIDTMQLVAENLMAVNATTLQESLSRISRLYSIRRAAQGISPEEMDIVAERLLEEVRNEFQRQVGTLKPALLIEVQKGRDDQPAIPPYRQIRGVFQNAVEILLADSSVRPSITTLTPIRVLPSAELSHHFGFLVEAAGSTDKLEIRLEDVFPELSQTFWLRLEGWVRRQLARLFKDFEEKLSAAPDFG